MTQFRPITIALLLSVSAACSTEQDHRAEDSAILIDAFAQDYPALSVSVYQQGASVWTYNHGVEGLGAGPEVTENTKFNAYSTAKAVTGLAFAKLVQSGAVALSDKVGDLAPDLPEVFHPITIKDLLSHRSGIRHYASPLDWLGYAQQLCNTPKDGLAYFAGDALLFEPGQQVHYSTFAFVLASEILNRVNGTEDFATALNSSLGEGAVFELDAQNAQKVQPLIKAGILPQLPEGVDPESIIPMPNLSAECKFGGGGLLMSSDQLAGTGASIFKNNGSEALTSWPDMSDIRYGAGYSEDTGRWQLSGGAPGGRSYLLVSLNAELSIAITGNFDGPNMGSVANQLADIWENKK